MTHSKMYKKYYQNKSLIIETFSKHKKFLFVFGLCCVFCVILAISTLVQRQGQIDFSNLLDKDLYAFLNGEISSTIMFFKVSLKYIFAILLIITACYFKPAIVIGNIIILYNLFTLIFNMGIFIFAFSIKGFIFYLCPIVINIVILFLLLLLLCFSIENCSKKCGINMDFKMYILMFLVITGLLILNNIIIKIISPILIIII